MMKHEIFDWLGGFMPWPCAADAHFFHRAKKYFNVQLLDQILFKRRIHTLNLTIKKETRFGSYLRSMFINQINKIKSSHTNEDAIIFTIVNQYYEVFPNTPIQYENTSIQNVN